MSASPKTKRRTHLSWRNFLVIAAITLVLTAAAGTAYLLFRAYETYTVLKQTGSLVTGNVIVADAQLGFAPRPNSRGEQKMMIPPPVDLAYDEHGFRVPLGETEVDTQIRQPVVLALGDSYTHGDACVADETFPYLVGEKLHGTSHNGGFFAYGLSQMLLLARRWIPEIHPDIVIVQYSPWIVDRSLTEFAPTRSFRRPQPYFYQERNGEIAIRPPVYLQRLFSMDASVYADSETSLRDFVSFLKNSGTAMVLADTLGVARYNLGKTFGLYPPPAGDRLRLLTEVYGEIGGLCSNSNSQFIICVIGHPLTEMRPDEVDRLRELPEATVVDTWDAITKALPSNNNDEFLRAFAHIRGRPPRIVNLHPNAEVHALIAEQIVRNISLGISRTNASE